MATTLTYPIYHAKVVCDLEKVVGTNPIFEIKRLPVSHVPWPKVEYEETVAGQGEYHGVGRSIPYPSFGHDVI